MANITEDSVFTANLREIATNDLVLGGPTGTVNLQAKDLGDRTIWLRDRLNPLYNLFPDYLGSQFGAGVVEGSFCYMDNTTDKWELAVPNNIDKLPEGIRSGNKVLTEGIYTRPTGSYTVGERYFCQNGGSALATLVVTESPVGVAVSTTQLQLQLPDKYAPYNLSNSQYWGDATANTKRMSINTIGVAAYIEYDNALGWQLKNNAEGAASALINQYRADRLTGIIGNTWTVGDDTSGTPKYIYARTAEASDPYLRWNNVNKKWYGSDNGTVEYPLFVPNVWTADNDGAGSGMDSDLLDGQHGAYYTDIPARLGYTPWHPGNDGTGSGLDADLLDGFDSSAFARLAAANIFTNALNTFKVAANGGVSIRSDPTNPGFVSFLNTTGVSQGYIGSIVNGRVRIFCGGR